MLGAAALSPGNLGSQGTWARRMRRRQKKRPKHMERRYLDPNYWDCTAPESVTQYEILVDIDIACSLRWQK